MKRSLLAMLLAVSFAVYATSTTQALHDTQSSSIMAVRDQTTGTVEDNSSEDKRLEMEARKEELEQKLAEKLAAVSEKLMGARAEKCQKKQVNINSMLDKRVESAQKHFDTFKLIQDRLVAIVKDKEIVIENQSAREIIISGYELEAQASIDTMKKVNFECKMADSAAPGAIVKVQISDVKQDLKDYRDAIKDYAQAIKASVEKTAETPAEEESTTEEAPAEETPSAEQSIEGVQQ